MDHVLAAYLLQANFKGTMTIDVHMMNRTFCSIVERLKADAFFQLAHTIVTWFGDDVDNKTIKAPIKNKRINQSRRITFRTISICDGH